MSQDKPNDSTDPRPYDQQRLVPKPNPFDPASLRLNADAEETLGIKKLITTIPVRKPNKTTFVRTHPDEEYHLQTLVLELKEENAIYLVAPGLRDALSTESTLTRKLLRLAIDRQGVVFLWPLRLPSTEGRTDAWARSALDAAEKAEKNWVRVAAKMSLGAYEICVAKGSLSEPEWPDLSLHQALEIAFRDHLIDSLDHPVLKRLRGET